MSYEATNRKNERALPMNERKRQQKQRSDRERETEREGGSVKNKKHQLRCKKQQHKKKCDRKNE